MKRISCFVSLSFRAMPLASYQRTRIVHRIFRRYKLEDLLQIAGEEVLGHMPQVDISALLTCPHIVSAPIRFIGQRPDEILLELDKQDTDPLVIYRFSVQMNGWIMHEMMEESEAMDRANHALLRRFRSRPGDPNLPQA